jgi:hypothetical protein
LTGLELRHEPLARQQGNLQPGKPVSLALFVEL